MLHCLIYSPKTPRLPLKHQAAAPVHASSHQDPVS